MLNFTKKYINNPNRPAGSIDTITIYEHKNGVQTVMNFPSFMDDCQNYLMVEFDSGRSVSVELKDGVIKVATNEDFRLRDLKNHPSWNKSRDLLVRIYLRHILGQHLNEKEMEAIQDAVKSEIKL